jgi:hypothetical protein
LAKRNPRWDLEEEDDAAEKFHSERIRVFSLASRRTLFISYLSGLLQMTGPIKLRALVFCPKERKEQQRSIYKKKREEEKSFANLQMEKVMQNKNI